MAKPLSADLALKFHNERFTDRGTPLVWYRNEWYLWVGSHYKVQAKDFLDLELAQYMIKGGSKNEYYAFASMPSVVKPAITIIKSFTCVDNDRQAPFNPVMEGEDFGYIPVKNGLIDIKAYMAGKRKVLRKHTPDLFYTGCLDVNFNKQATMKHWPEFMSQTFNNDETLILVTQEFFGYCFDPKLRLQKCLLLQGEGANGKSVVLDTIVNLLGEDNVSSVGLEHFGKQFSLYATLGKFANVAADLETLNKVSEGAYKKYVSQDVMQFERKNCDPFSTRPTARLIMSANQEPRFNDRTNAAWRRMMLIKCENVLEEDDQDCKLSDKIKDDDLEGILIWALEGLKRLYEKEQFTASPQMKEWLDEYKADNNPHLEFLKENYEVNGAKELPSKEVYEAYKGYMEDNGRKPLGERLFGKIVKKHFKCEKVRRQRTFNSKITKVYYYVGIDHIYIPIAPRDGSIIKSLDEVIDEIEL